VISENPAISKDSKPILKQEEKSHTSQNVFDHCHKKDVSMQQKIIAHIFIYLENYINNFALFEYLNTSLNLN